MPALITDLRGHILANVDVQTGAGCWIWKMSSETNGYGRFFAGGRRTYAHRASYELFVGAIPDGYQIDHLCRVRRCVNPGHLEAVSQAENIYRSEAPTIVNWRNDVCKHGHSMADAYPNRRKGRVVGRVCRTCNRMKNARRHQHRRAEP